MPLEWLLEPLEWLLSHRYRRRMATATFGKSGIANHEAGHRCENRNHFEA